MSKLHFMALVMTGFFVLVVMPAQATNNEVFAQSAFGDPSEQRSSGGGGLMAVEANIDGGEIPLGSTAQIVVRFRNEGSRPIEFRGLNLYPSSTISAEAGINQCAQEPLVGGAECAIIVSAKGLQPGGWRIEMLIRHTGASRLVTARINGSVAAGDESVSLVQDLEVLPSPVDFGTLEASRPIIRSLTIRNITAEAVEVQDMYIDAPSQSGYELRTDCKTLQSGQGCIASILWSPSIEGPSSGFLVIEHDGASAVTNIPLSGTFEPGQAEQADIFPNSQPGKGVLVSSEVEVDFGSDINAQSAITVSLVNVGDAELTLESIQLAGSENGLKLLKNGCDDDMILSPTQACPLTISWAPTRTGGVIDDVQIRHNGARGILVLPVRGVASEAISVDSKPIILTQDAVGGFNGGTSTSSGSNRNAGVTAPVLDGYTITSHSSNHAIIRGPIGSRIVTDGKNTLIGGFEWNVDITDIGVRLTSGVNIVLLVFDRSLSNVGGESE
jgi:hypothetical protein